MLYCRVRISETGNNRLSGYIRSERKRKFLGKNASASVADASTAAFSLLFVKLFTNAHSCSIICVNAIGRSSKCRRYTSYALIAERVLLPHAASDSVSAAAQKRERIFLLFIKNDLLRHCVSHMLPRGCRFSLSPWNEVIIARQPKKTKGKFEHFVFHENAKSSAA